MKHSFSVKHNGVYIRQVQKGDLESLREWRNRQELSRYLRPIGEITPEMQKSWYEDYLTDDSIVMFAIEETEGLNRLVGSCGIYDFNGKESNCGKIIIGDPEAGGKGVGYRGELLSLHTGFQKFGFEYYIREVNTENIKSLKMTSKLGFKKTGERSLEYGGSEYLYKMTRDEFYTAHPELISVEVNE